MKRVALVLFGSLALAATGCATFNPSMLGPVTDIATGNPSEYVANCDHAAAIDHMADGDRIVDGDLKIASVR